MSGDDGQRLTPKTMVLRVLLLIAGVVCAWFVVLLFVPEQNEDSRLAYPGSESSVHTDYLLEKTIVQRVTNGSGGIVVRSTEKDEVSIESCVSFSCSQEAPERGPVSSSFLVDKSSVLPSPMEDQWMIQVQCDYSASAILDTAIGGVSVFDAIVSGTSRRSIEAGVELPASVTLGSADFCVIAEQAKQYGEGSVAVLATGMIGVNGERILMPGISSAFLIRRDTNVDLFTGTLDTSRAQMIPQCLDTYCSNVSFDVSGE